MTSLVSRSCDRGSSKLTLASDIHSPALHFLLTFPLYKREKTNQTTNQTKPNQKTLICPDIRSNSSKQEENAGYKCHISFYSILWAGLLDSLWSQVFFPHQYWKLEEVQVIHWVIQRVSKDCSLHLTRTTQKHRCVPTLDQHERYVQLDSGHQMAAFIIWRS